MKETDALFRRLKHTQLEIAKLGAEKELVHALSILFLIFGTILVAVTIIIALATQ